ncbi:thioesterase domain-containing protein [Neolewinella xylanilytica]|uniref:Thioesterase domain-containing protein n=1 Tax=Neolewinella xylanilytica TaxID=1514080 RepID=A0A2S6I266_9BACT|nr:condensation domain-containing protein [Neolewinella xylanilytica]PPK85264.1 thioesterase domain-containing protein [Neolewinella xylanilytica]
MTSQANKKIEAVYPLNELQRALLFHHRADPTHDEGLIQVHFRLTGLLDRRRFLEAWQQTFRRHPVLRASVHWENISQPVWVIHPAAAPDIQWLEGAGAQERSPSDQWQAFLAADRNTPLELSKSPACRLTGLSVDGDTHYFAWTSHHLLLDGWSAEVVLRDVLRFYAGEDLAGAPIPSHKDYLRWKQQQRPEEATAFWRQQLDRHRGPTLFPAARGSQVEVRAVVTGALKAGVERYARARGLSLNTVVQGVWACLLGRYFGTPTVSFGTTVSGRPPEMPGFETVAGMYVHVLPKIVDLEPAGDFLQEIQLVNGRSQPYSYLTEEELYDDTVSPPFNNLLTVQNFPWKALSGGGLRVTDYHGDMTSTYPLSCVVVLRDEWTIVLRHLTDSVTQRQAEWFLNGFRQLLERLTALADGATFTVAMSREDLGPPPRGGARPGVAAYVPPANRTQVELVRIWSGLLPVDRIGIDDDFFDLGGTSFLALRLFNRIEQHFGRRISPSILLHHRSVRRLAERVSDTGEADGWNNLVPIRVAGQLPPLFCFHAGEGNVLMYQELLAHLHPDRPVYALQPNGIDGASELDGSIETMAAHYLAEIDQLGAPDPLNLVAYCYSGAICLEIGRLLLASGRPAPRIVGTDIDPPGYAPAESGGRTKRRRGSLRWYWGHLRLGLWDTAFEQFAGDVLPDAWLGEELRLRLRARRLKMGLIDAYDRYAWPDYAGEVLLLRSRDLRRWKTHDHVVNAWQRVTGGRLKLGDIDSGHEDMYRAPAVEEVASKIEAYVTSGRS